MFAFLKKIFGPGVNYAELVKNGAIVIDVRTKGEYQSGHIKGSLNISLTDLGSISPKLDKDKTIITCCASGMRSATAKGILKGKGFTNVYNGGGWISLQRKILQ